MAGDQINIGVVVDFKEVENLEKISTEITKSLKRIVKSFDGKKIEFNFKGLDKALQSLHLMLDKVERLNRSLKEAAQSGERLSKSSLGERKRRSENTGSQQRARDGGGAGIDPGQLNKIVEAVEGERKNKEAINELSESAKKTREEFDFLERSMQDFRNLIARFSSLQATQKAAMDNRTGSQGTIEGFPTFNQEAAKAFDKEFRVIQARAREGLLDLIRLQQKFNIALQRIGSGVTNPEDLGIPADLFERFALGSKNIEGVRKTLVRVTNSIDKQRNAYMDLSGSVEIARRQSKKLEEQNKTAQKVQSRYNDRVDSFKRFMSEATDARNEFLKTGNVSAIDQFSERFEKFNRKIVEDIKAINKFSDQLHTSMAASKQAIGLYGDRVKKVSKEIEKANSVQGELSKAQKAQLGDLKAQKQELESLIESEKNFVRTTQVMINQAEEQSRELNRLGSNVREVNEDFRSLSRIQAENAKLNERSQRNFVRLGRDIEHLKQNILILKSQTKDGIIDESVGRAAKKFVSDFQNAFKKVIKNAGALRSGLKSELEKLDVRFENRTGSFSALDEEDFAEGGKAEQLLKRLKDKVRENFNSMIGEAQAKVKELRGVMERETFQTVEAMAKNFDRLSETRKQFNKLGEQADVLQERIVRLKKVGAGKLINDRGIVNAANTFKALRKEFRSVQNEIDKLRTRTDLRFGLFDKDQNLDNLNSIEREALEMMDKLQARAKSLRSSMSGMGAFDQLVVDSDQLQKLQKNFRKVAGDASSFENKVALLQQQLKRGGAASVVAAEDLLELGKEARKAAKASARLVNQYEMLQKQGVKLSNEQKKLLKDARRSIPIFNRQAMSIARSEEELKNLAKTAKVAGKRFRIYNKQLASSIIDNLRFVQSMTIVTSVIFGAQMAFTELIEESRALARTYTVMRSSTMSFAEVQEVVKDRVREAAIAFGESVETTSEVVKQLGSAGFSTETALSALNETMKLVVATQADAESATRTVAGIYRVFGDQIRGAGSEAQAFRQINDVLISVYRNHQVELDELTQGFKFAGAAANAVGISFQDTAAFLSVLNDNMIKSGTAGRSLQVIFSQLAKKSDDFSEAFGIALDPDKTLDEQFLKILEGVNKRLSTGALSARELKKRFDVFGLRGARSFITLSQKFEDVQKAVKELNEEAEGTGAALSKIVRDSLVKEFESAKQALLGIVRTFEKPLKDLIVIFAKIVSGVQEFVATFEPALQNTGLIIVFAGALTLVVQTVIALARIFATLAVEINKTMAGFQGFISTLATTQVQATRTSATLQALGRSAESAGMKMQAVKGMGLASMFSKMAGPIGIIITVLGVAAAAWGAYERSTRAAKREIQDIAVEIDNLQRDSKKLKDFQKEMVDIAELAESTRISDDALGQKVVQAYDKVGSRLVSNADVVRKTNKEIAQDIEGIVKSSQRLANVAQTVRENELKKQREELNKQIEESFAKNMEDTFADGLPSRSKNVGSRLWFGFTNIDVLLNAVETVATLGQKDGFAEAEARAFGAMATDAEDVEKRIKSVNKEIAQLKERIKSAKETSLFNIDAAASIPMLQDTIRELESTREAFRQGQKDAEEFEKSVLKTFNQIAQQDGVGEQEALERLRKLLEKNEEALEIKFGFDIDDKRIQQVMDRVKAELSRVSVAKPFDFAEMQGEEDILENTFAGLEQIRDLADAPFDPGVFNSVVQELRTIEDETVAINRAFVSINEDIQATQDAVGGVDFSKFFELKSAENIDFSKTFDELKSAENISDGFGIAKAFARRVKNFSTFKLSPGEAIQFETEELTSFMTQKLGALPEDQKKQVLEALAEAYGLNENIFQGVDIDKDAGDLFKKIIDQSKDFDLNNKQTLTSTNKLAEMFLTITQSIGRASKEAQNLSKQFGEQLMQKKLEEVNAQLERMAKAMKSAVFSELTFNPIRQLRLEARKLNQEQVVQEELKGSVSEMIDKYTVLMSKIRKKQDLLEEGKDQKAAEVDSRSVQDMIQQGEILKKNIDLQAGQIRAYKKIKDTIVLASNELRRQSMEYQTIEKNLQSNTAQISEQISKQSELLEMKIEEDKETEKLGNNYGESVEILSSYVEKMQSIVELQQELNAALEEEVALRFKTISQAQKILDPENKAAGVKAEIAEITARIGALNQDIEDSRKLGTQGLFERNRAQRKIVDLLGRLMEIRESLNQEEEEANEIISKRVDILEKIRDLYENQSEDLADSFRQNLEKAFERNRLQAAVQVADDLGMNVREVLNDTSRAMDLYVEALEEGSVSSTSFGQRQQALLEQIQKLQGGVNQTTDVINKIQQTKFDSFIQKATQAISEGDIEKARKFADPLVGIAETLSGDDQNLLEEKLKRILSLENQIANMEVRDEGQIEISLSFEKQLDELIKQARERLQKIIDEQAEQGSAAVLSIGLEAGFTPEALAEFSQLIAGTATIADKKMLSSAQLLENHAGKVTRLSTELERAMSVVTKNFGEFGSKLEAVNRAVEGFRNINGSQVRKKKSGGKLPGYGGGDQIPAMLEPGEYIIPKESVKRYGTSFFDSIRNGSLQGFQEGGEAVIAAARSNTGSAVHRAKTNATIEAAKAGVKAAIVDVEIETDVEVVADSNLKAANKAQEEVLKNGERFLNNLTKTVEDFDRRMQSGSELLNKSILEMRDANTGRIDFRQLFVREYIKGVNGFFQLFVKAAQKNITSMFQDIFVPEFAAANAELFDQYLEELQNIEEEFKRQFSTIERGLQRNETNYFDYLNRIEDAERQNLERRLDAERQYRESLTTTREVIEESFTKFFDENVANLAKNVSGKLGEIGEKISAKSMQMVAGQAAEGLAGVAQTGGQLGKVAGGAAALTGPQGMAIGAGISLLSTIIPPIVDVMGKIIKLGFRENMDVTVDFIQQFAREFPEVADEFSENLISNLGMLADVLEETMPSVMEKLGQMMGELLPKIGLIFEDMIPMMLASFARGLPELLSGLTSLFHSLLITLFNTVPIIISMIVQSIPVIMMTLIIELLTGRLLVTIVKVIFLTLAALVVGIIDGFMTALTGRDTGASDRVMEMAAQSVQNRDGTMKKFHTGGVIPGRQAQEVAILAQAGEGVLSRQGLRALGGPGVLQQLNSGNNPYIAMGPQSMSSSNVTPTRSSGSTSEVRNESTVINLTGNNFSDDPAKNDRLAKRLADKLDKELAKKKRDRTSRFDRV